MSQGRPYPIYIVLTPFREIAPSVRVMFRALDKVEPYVEYVEGFYREDGDEALVALQFQREAIEQAGPGRFLEIVRRCNLPIIAPEKLSLERRVSFHHEHLSSFPTRVQRYRMDGESMVQSIVLALEEHVAIDVEDDDYDMVELEPEISVVPEPIDDSEPRRRSSQWEIESAPTTVAADTLRPSTPRASDTVADIPQIDPDTEAEFDAAATRAFDASFGDDSFETDGDVTDVNDPVVSEPDIWF